MFYKARVFDRWDRCFDFLTNYAYCVEKDSREHPEFKAPGTRAIWLENPEDELRFETYGDAQDALIQFYKHSQPDRYESFSVLEYPDENKTPKIFLLDSDDLRNKS